MSREKLMALLNRHRTHVQNSPGVGGELQRYAIAVIDDIDMELRTLAASAESAEVMAVIEDTNYGMGVRYSDALHKLPAGTRLIVHPDDRAATQEGLDHA